MCIKAIDRLSDDKIFAYSSDRGEDVTSYSQVDKNYLDIAKLRSAEFQASGLFLRSPNSVLLER